MEAVKLFGLRRCSTCVKARKWLNDNNIEHHFVDYRDEPLDSGLVVQWARQLGWNVLINKASTSWRGLSDEQKQASDDDQWLALVAEHPTLIKRPVLVYGDRAAVGFSDTRYTELFA